LASGKVLELSVKQLNVLKREIPDSCSKIRTIRTIQIWIFVYNPATGYGGYGKAGCNIPVIDSFLTVYVAAEGVRSLFLFVPVNGKAEQI
jgi:hypothetical protein